MVCRVCLENTNAHIQIFDANGLEQRIPDILELHLWFTPSPTDPISKTICLTCWCKVLEFHNFYEAAKEAHKFYSKQHEISVTENDATHHPVEIVDTVFSVKNEDTEDEKWLTNVNDTKSYGNKAENIDENPLYEPEVLEPINVKTEKSEADKLDEPRTKTRKRNENSKSEERKISYAESDEDDSYEGNFASDNETHSDYEPESAKTNSSASVATSSVNVPKTAKRGRPSAVKTKSPKPKVVKRNTSANQKRRKHCWSSPQDDEMVSKHLPLNCEICCLHVENYNEMIKHFQDIHKNVRPYIVCCGRRLSKRQRVVQHAYKHEDPNYFQCEICKKNFSDNYVLRSHMLAHHPEEDELIHQCDQCEKKFSRRYLLELHKPVHIPVAERKFVCSKCPRAKAFASDHLLKIHDSMRHRRAANVCHVCAKTIRDNQAFEKHVRLHFEESGPRVKCPRPDCDRWLKDEDNLKQHLRRHNDEGKIITCDQCGKSVKNRRALSSHISYAHSTTMFNCEECKKSFKKAITLKEHMAQHTGETLYKCPFCPRTFNSNANMHSHKKKMHPLQWDIWRKTKTGSSQSFQSNNQFMELVHNVREQNSQESMPQEQQQAVHEGAIMYQTNGDAGI